MLVRNIVTALETNISFRSRGGVLLVVLGVVAVQVTAKVVVAIEVVIAVGLVVIVLIAAAVVVGIEVVVVQVAEVFSRCRGVLVFEEVIPVVVVVVVVVQAL